MRLKGCYRDRLGKSKPPAAQTKSIWHSKLANGRHLLRYLLWLVLESLMREGMCLAQSRSKSVSSYNTLDSRKTRRHWPPGLCPVLLNP